MATFLHRLGQLAFRRRRLFLTLWIVMLAAEGHRPAGQGVPAGRSWQRHRARRFRSTRGAETDLREQQGGDRRPGRRPAEGAAGGERLRAVRQRTGQQGRHDRLHPGHLHGAQADITTAASAALQHAADEGEKAGLRMSLCGNAGQEEAAGKVPELIGVVAALVLVITFGSMIAAGAPPTHRDLRCGRGDHVHHPSHRLLRVRRRLGPPRLTRSPDSPPPGPPPVLTASSLKGAPSAPPGHCPATALGGARLQSSIRDDDRTQR